jgi:hypothetical protein
MSAEVLERWRERASIAEANRASFPLATQMLDELRAEGFGNARITHAALPDGRSVGKASQGVPAPVVEDRKLKFFLYEREDLIARKRAGIR